MTLHYAWGYTDSDCEWKSHLTSVWRVNVAHQFRLLSNSFSGRFACICLLILCVVVVVFRVCVCLCFAAVVVVVLVTIFPLKSNNNRTVVLLLLFRGKIVCHSMRDIMIDAMRFADALLSKSFNSVIPMLWTDTFKQKTLWQLHFCIIITRVPLFSLPTRLSPSLPLWTVGHQVPVWPIAVTVTTRRTWFFFSLSLSIKTAGLVKMP